MIAPSETYHQYELILARNILVPFFQEMDIDLDNKHVLDVGCGHGGILNGLAESFRLQGLGIDYDPHMVAQCRNSPGVSFEQADFLTGTFDRQFDVILLRDVLEHCGNFPLMLEKTASLLAPDGIAYITYTPFLSPFGGHQHVGTTLFAHIPYIHVLPERLFLKLIKPAYREYKSNDFLLEDLRRVRQTRITTTKLTTACQHCRLSVSFKRTYCIRPDYYYKFHLPVLAAPKCFPLTTAFDPFSTSVELLLTHQAQCPPTRTPLN